MNRQERRKLERQGVPKKAVMDQALRDVFQNGYDEGRMAILEPTFYMIAYTLQYKLGFGAKRLQNIMFSIFDNIDAYRTGHLTKEDYKTIKKEMIEKYGVKLV